MTEPSSTPSAGTAEHDDPTFTARELDVMRLLAKGMSNAEMASELYIGAETVKSRLSAIYRKIGVSGRGQTVAWMMDRPALAVDPDAPVASVVTEPIDNGIRVLLVGEFDMTVLPLLSEALEGTRRSNPATVELDMAQVTFIDSAALRALVSYRAKEPRIDARIVNASPQVSRVIRFAGLMALFGMTE